MTMRIAVIGAGLMGADPLAAAETLGDALYHVHAKDTLLRGVMPAKPSDYQPQAI